jgi:hypothetical protein
VCIPVFVSKYPNPFPDMLPYKINGVAIVVDDGIIEEAFEAET